MRPNSEFFVQAPLHIISIKKHLQRTKGIIGTQKASEV